MNFITKSLLKPISQWYSGINSATLTGAIDVVVVQQPDGTYLSTPFHVRFGKLGVLRAKEKIVDIEINNNPVDIHMKLEESGIAVFAEQVSADDQLDDLVATSPIPEVVEVETSANIDDVKSASHFQPEDVIASMPTVRLRKKRKRKGTTIGVERDQVCVDANQGPLTAREVVSDSECDASGNARLVTSDNEDDDGTCNSIDRSAEWNWGQLPAADGLHAAKALATSQTSIDMLLPPPDTNIEVAHRENEDNTCNEGGKAKRQSWIFPLWRRTSGGQTTDQSKSQLEVGSCPTQGGLYLDQLMAANDEMAALYLGHPPSSPPQTFDSALPSESDHLPLHNEDTFDVESGNGPSLASGSSPGSFPDDAAFARRDTIFYDNSEIGGGDDDDDSDIIESDLSRDRIVIAMAGPDHPERNVSFDEFLSIITSLDGASLRKLLVKMPSPDGQSVVSYPWAVAAPILLSRLAYNRTLPEEAINRLMMSNEPVETKELESDVTEKQSRKSWWFFRSNVDSGGAETKSDPPEDLVPHVEQSDTETVKEPKTYVKTLRLSSDSIKRLNLQPGVNTAHFSVTTAYQGTTRCSCHIFVWCHTDKIVVSDIDGTITRSDVLGQVLPLVGGGDWAQMGVAALFDSIVRNGFRVLFLSARAIGQASLTKDYLLGVKQGKDWLPEGPLFLNPTSLIRAFHREVIEKKPEEFKIACLRDIQQLFPTNPFYAGYGNRVNDVYAYRAVGIPLSRIFTINYQGQLRPEFSDRLQSSYSCQTALVDHIFPPQPCEVDYYDPSVIYRYDYSNVQLPSMATTEDISRDQSADIGEDCSAADGAGPDLTDENLCNSHITPYNNASLAAAHLDDFQAYQTFNYWRQPIPDAEETDSASFS